MTPRPRRLILSAAACALVLACAPAGRAQFTITTGTDYSTGHYGEGDKTKVFSITNGVQYEHGRWTLKLTTPYLHLSGPGTVVPGIGRVQKVTLPPRRDESGYGDTTLTASYVAHQTADGLFTVAVGGEVKFGTADSGKGLGTGQDDFTVHTDGYWTHGQLTTFVTLGYRKLGDPPGSDLLNPIYGTVGWSFQANKETSFGLMYSASEKSSASSSSQAEVIAFATRKFGAAWNSQLYLMAGTTKASPDLGGGLSLSRVF